MPIYEYEREDGTKFEVHQAMDDDRLEECPDTGQKCKRVISGGMIAPIKRGGGWPDKQAKKKKWREENPNGTTLKEYRDKIDENTRKTKEIKSGKNPKDL